MIDRIRPFGGFDYVQSGNPTIDVNPGFEGALWLNMYTGEVFICNYMVTNDNFWVGQLGTTVGTSLLERMEVNLPKISWYDASNTASLWNDVGKTIHATDGLEVWYWDDISGNNHHLDYITQYSPAKPSFVESLLGFPALDFSGTSDGMTADFMIDPPVTYYHVVTQHAWGDNDYFSESSGILTENRHILRTIGSSPEIEFHAGSTIRPITTFAPYTKGVIKVEMNGASSKLRHNLYDEITGNAGSNMATGICLGRLTNGLNYSKVVDWHETIIYDGVHSTEMSNFISERLMTKWGVSFN